jgi:hypothetical protein
MKLKSLSQKDRYGNMFSFEFFEPDASIPMMMMIPDMADGYNGADTSNHPGEPKGTDTVPAWLTPGENVVNAEASRLPGNQEKIDEMNEQGRAVQQAQGGPIPTYAAGGMEVPRYDGMLNSLGQRLGDRDGGPMYSAVGSKVPSWLTDEVLDSLKMVESSGDPMATSEVGAQGLYQIMPATARQPGMNVPPLAIEDIRDPVKSREFARNYLTGIASANPDFTPEEVLTAYHSGASNVRKAKAGTEALGPRGQAYAGKIMDNMSDPDKFGVTRRQVSTVPGTVIGTIGDQKVYSDDMGEFVMTPEGEVYLDDNQLNAMTPLAPAEVPVPEPDAPVPSPTAIDFSQYSDPVTGPRVPTQIAGSEDQRIRDEAILKTMEVPSLNEAGGDIGDEAYNELYSIPPSRMSDISPQTTDRYGVPKSKLPKTESLGKQGLRNKVTAAEEEIAKAEAELAAAQAQLEIEISSSGGVTPQTVEKGKKAKKDLEDAKATKAGVEKDIAKLDSAEAKVISDRQKEADEILDFEVSTVPATDAAPPKPEDATKTSDRASAALAKVQAAAKQNAEAAKQIKEDEDEITDQGNKTLKSDPTFAESIMQGFKDMFGELFDPKELARMAVMYAGSRALGYDHSASLGYSAKQYVKRIDAEYTQRQKDVRDKDFMEAYTKESLDNYLKTGDRNDLIEKPISSSAMNITGQSGTTFDRFTGTEVPVYKMGSGKDARLVVKSGDGFVDATSSRFEVVNPKLHDLNEIRDEFQKRLGNQVDELNKAIDKDSPKLDFSTETLANEARALYVSNRDLFRMNNKKAVKLSDEITLAQKDFLQDYKKHMQNPSEFDKPTSIEGYYNKRIIKLKTGGVFSYNDVKNTNPENLDILEKTLSNAAANAAINSDGNLDRETYVKVYRQLWTDAKADWKEVKNKDAFKADGYDPIIQWMITEAFK